LVIGASTTRLRAVRPVRNWRGEKRSVAVTAGFGPQSSGLPGAALGQTLR
jgi:hypothetical protein